MTSDNANALGPFLTNRFGDRYLYEVNRNAFDQIGSEAVYQRHFGQRLQVADKLYIVVGSDSGLLLNYLGRHKLPQGSRYLVVELAPVLDCLRASSVLMELSDQIALVTPEAFWEQAASFRFSDYVYLGAVEFIEAICTTDSYVSEYRELACSLQETLQRSAWNITANMGQTLFIEKQLDNLAENRLEASLLQGLCPGKTAVILAGGPSLGAIVPWLRANIDRVAVFAVSRVSRQLLDWGIPPHLVFCVDPQDVSFNVSREMLQFDEKTLFINAYHVSPLLLGQWPWRSLYLGPRFPWESSLNPNNLAGTGPTVTNAALFVAVAMGFSQVIFAGVDLCYSSTGVTHASGSIESVAGPRLRNTVTVETNDGGNAETGPDYAAAITAMGEQAQYALSKGCHIVNPMPQAAKIPHVAHCALEDIRIEPLDQPMDHLLREHLPSEDAMQRSGYYRAILGELDRVRGSLRKIANLVDEALDCNARLFGRNGRKGDFKYKIRMDKIEKRLNREFASEVYLIKRYGIRSFFKIVRPGGKESWSDEEIEQAGRAYYEAYRESVRKLLALVDGARERLAVRLEEEVADPDFAALAEQWRKDNQPGRARVWLQQHPGSGARLSPQAQEVLSGFEQLMAAQSAQAEAKQMKIIKLSRSLKGVDGLAQRLFKSGNLDRLQRLKESLTDHPNPAESQPLEHMIGGYIAELKGAPEEALGRYEALVGETFGPMTEVALKRILSISLGRHDVDLALTALDCLANASPVYQPQYAELLRIVGRLQDAADVYVSYLEIVPEDLTALLKLGQIYRAMGQEPAARQVFSMVLQAEPENPAALALMAGS